MRRTPSPDGAVSGRRVLGSAAGAFVVGVAVVSLAAGFSGSFAVRMIQAVAVFAAGAVVLGGVIGFALVRLGGWRHPEDEDEFEALVQRAEQLAAEGRWGSGDEDLPGFEDDEDVYALDGDEDFAALVRLALDDLPLEFHRVLEHVAIVVSDGGAEHRAYGLYQGDTVARDYFTDRLLIFRDTLTRDFGYDPELLRSQVTRTVRHELAHHLGWGETGVRGLGL